MKKFILLFFVLHRLIAFNQEVLNIYKSDQTIITLPVYGIDSINYSYLSSALVPVVSTISVEKISSTIVKMNGNITNSGTSILSKGFCYSVIGGDPALNDTIIINESNAGNFSIFLTTLNPYWNYQITAFATNNAGIGYGNSINFSFSTPGIIQVEPGNGVFDINGHFYPTTILGNGQEWMAKNLTATCYSNGDSIPHVSDANIWATLSTDAWSLFNNDVHFENPCGKLYNWYVVSDNRNVCPTGWHIPTQAEWNSLITYVRAGNYNNSYVLKIAGIDYWSATTSASNLSGFTAHPAGRRNSDGTFGYGVGYPPIDTWWWGSDYTSPNFRYSLEIKKVDNTYQNINEPDLKVGLSIRCLKD